MVLTQVSVFCNIDLWDQMIIWGNNNSHKNEQPGFAEQPRQFKYIKNIEELKYDERKQRLHSGQFKIAKREEELKKYRDKPAYFKFLYYMPAMLSSKKLRDFILRNVEIHRFDNLHLKNLDFRAQYLGEVDFKHSILQGFNLQNAGLKGAFMPYVKFPGSSCRRASFDKANLVRANFIGALNIDQASFKDAQLQFALLRDLDLKDADFSGADLTKANLHGTNLAGVNFSKATFKRTDLTNACGLTPAAFKGAVIDRSTLKMFPNAWAREQVEKIAHVVEDEDESFFANFL